MVSASFCCIASSFMMIVWRFLSSPRVSLLVLAYSVRLMYSASSLVARFFAVVVLPTHGVPVTRMTRFMSVFEVSVIVIACAFGSDLLEKQIDPFS